MKDIPERLSDLSGMRYDEIRAAVESYTTVLDDCDNEAPTVDVCMVVFNHERFCRESIKSVLAQKTDFSVHILVGEDCSTDGTRKILLEYQRLFPERIRLFLSTQNLGIVTGNGRLNFLRLLDACRGKYIALLDGDDYWTDPHKLQKQVDYLEAHPECSSVFSRACYVDENGKEAKFNGASLFGPPRVKPVYRTTDLLGDGNFIPTGTLLFRRECVDGLPDWFSCFRVGDWPLNVLNAGSGPIGFIDAVTAAYRVHGDSFYNALSMTEKLNTEDMCYQEFQRVLGREHASAIRRGRSRTSYHLAVAHLREGRRSASNGYFVRSIMLWPFDCRKTCHTLGLLIRSIGRSTLMLMGIVRKT